MRHFIYWLLLAGVAGLFSPSVAQAECREDARQVSLDKDNVRRLKSYACRVGTVEIKAELHRFSEGAASLIVAKRSSTLLMRTIGTPKLAENDVFRAYAELLQKFGFISEDPPDGRSISVEGSDPVPDKIAGSKIRVLPPLATGGDYPAADEIAALRKKTIPAGLRFFYGIACQDEDKDKFPARTTCRDYDKNAFEMNFWRPLRPDDLENFTKNTKAYNALLTSYKAQLRASGKGTDDTGNPLSSGLPADLKLFQFLASGGWPEDFLYLQGGFSQGAGCQLGIGGWQFAYTGRPISLDAILIENASKQPVTIDGLFGSRASEPRLRPVGSSLSPGAGAGQVGDMNETLAPGQKLLVPIRINLGSDQAAKSNFRYAQASREILARVGTNKFNGNVAAHEAPRLRDYAYGPELTVSGILVNGTRVDLVQQVANFTVLSMSSEAGSCPYLLSWDAKDQEWIHHGKVLHRAQGHGREYSEAITIAGFQSRFRLEEREPEVAFIDHAELTVLLHGGATLTLKSQDARLAVRDENYLRLLWGEEVEFAFELPHDVAATDVAESRLVLTGFYERYSSLLAGADTPAVPASATLSRLMGESPMSRAGQMCPAPELATSAVDNDL